MRAQWAIKAFPGLVAIIALIAMVSSAHAIGLLGFWTLVVIGGVTGLRLLYAGARCLIGPDAADGGREAAVAAAVLLAALVSPPATRDLASFVAGGARALFIETPAHVRESEASSRSEVAAVVECWRDGRACLTAGPSTLTQVPLKPTSFLKNINASEAVESSARGRTTAWIVFFGTGMIVLLLARAMARARERYGAEVEGSQGERISRDVRVMISYPAWIALCVYAAILAPAAYFSVGSLLYLDLDAPSSNLSAISEALNDAERSALDRLAGVDVNIDALEQHLRVRLPADDPDAERIAKAIAVGRGSLQSIQQGRDAYEKRALEYAAELKASATASQFEDYRLLLVANYGRVINETRLEARPCLERLGLLHEALAQTADPATSGAGGPRPATREGWTGGAPGGPPGTSEPWRRQLDNAVDVCGNVVNFPDAPASMDLQTEQGSFPGVLYGWLAKSSQATVLIVGLVGFGLFGAAIRTMGRPDKAVVRRRDDAYAFALSSNTAKILVQGLGAAFTVFLGGQAGADILTIGGKTNAFGLLLFCFVGAVFAEEIWRSMEKLLGDRLQNAASREAGPQAAAAGPTPSPSQDDRAGPLDPGAPPARP